MRQAMRLLGSDLACIRGGRQVFRDLGFAVGAGEALAVTGPNGVGKSTLLRLIAGLVRPSHGRLALEGGDPELTIGEQAHYLGHQDALKPALSVRENLGFWADFLGGGAAKRDEAPRACRRRPRWARPPARDLPFGRAAAAPVARPPDRGGTADLAAR